MGTKPIQRCLTIPKLQIQLTPFLGINTDSFPFSYVKIAGDDERTKRIFLYAWRRLLANVAQHLSTEMYKSVKRRG